MLYAAIDCEMVQTAGVENALARVSIGKNFFYFVSFWPNMKTTLNLVDEKHKVLLDTIVIPPGGKVINYRTRFSGMTEKVIKEKGIDFNKAKGTRNDFFSCDL